MRKSSKPFVAILLAALTLPLFAVPLARTRAAAAGGSVAGTVTDPRGAVVVGAAVTVYAEAGGQPAGGAKTDAKGQYSIENLPPGAYVVVVEAGGFNALRLERQVVEEGKTTKLDVRLEVTGVETQVEVKSGGLKANEDPVYRQLRDLADSPQAFAGEYAAVSNLVLKRDAATFTLRSGEIYFLPAVEGRVTGGVFIGDGEFTLTPPVEYEKRSLSLFTGQPSITEQFTKLTLRFTDKTFEEVKAAPQAKMASGGPQGSRARDIFRDNQSLLRKELKTNMEMRTLVDIYTPQRPGFLVAFIGGKRFEKLVYQIDPF
ncbi:MAG TPA: carboxypeptidase-like regulatory domain-containing protein, partial [Pyrinomonadaceae bacterium]|nr:carboxypeptidase-like regulatory domain-containing protein [Pyrinomonadaceae bacterium]